MFGSLRLGYMIPPASLGQDFVNAKQICDMGSSAIEQAALANFMANGGFTRHLRQLGKALRNRREIMLEGLRKYGRGRVQIADSHAGMHVVVWLPGYDEAKLHELIDHAHKRGLGLYPMAPHYHARPATPGLLLGYCGLPAAELREAMRLFGKCLDALDVRRRG